MHIGGNPISFPTPTKKTVRIIQMHQMARGETVEHGLQIAARLREKFAQEHKIAISSIPEIF